jgi:hypothetical protein
MINCHLTYKTILAHLNFRLVELTTTTLISWAKTSLPWSSLWKSSIKWLNLWCPPIHKTTLWLPQRASQFRAMAALTILSTLLIMILIAVKDSFLINSNKTLIRVLYLHLIREVSILMLILAPESSAVGIATLALLPFLRLQIIEMWL